MHFAAKVGDLIVVDRECSFPAGKKGKVKEVLGMLLTIEWEDGVEGTINAFLVSERKEQ